MIRDNSNCLKGLRSCGPPKSSSICNATRVEGYHCHYYHRRRPPAAWNTIGHSISRLGRRNRPKTRDAKELASLLVDDDNGFPDKSSSCTRGWCCKASATHASTYMSFSWHDIQSVARTYRFFWLRGPQTPSQSTWQRQPYPTKSFQSEGLEDAVTWPSQASTNECCLFSSNKNSSEHQLGTTWDKRELVCAGSSPLESV
jgi:hypothetical protein